jgi:hypothetical protein
MRPVNYVPKSSRLIFVKDLGMKQCSNQLRRFGIYKCECGNKVKKQISCVKNGDTRSCGCLNRERITKHGYGCHDFYNIWYNMIDRCYNENHKSYKDYGDRGITVCDEWKDDPVKFIKWALPLWEKGLQIDRRDNDGNYYPGNCRFMTPRENTLNQRLLTSANTSGYRGICYHINKKRWCAQIRVNGKLRNLGYFDSPRLAALRYDVEAYLLNDGRPRNFI